MKWPTHSDYQDSIQNPATCFPSPELKTGTIICDALGLPRVRSGNFACVYELHTPAGRWAIRCFVRQVMGQQGRYARLSQYLAGVDLEYLVKFEYILKGILVQGEWYPIVQMEWVQGQQLNTYVEDRLTAPEQLRSLAGKLRQLVKALQVHRLAHGDLQHGNVMVTADGELRLVDYDGMYCPAFGRGRSPELGHTNFQHPLRVPEFYEEGLDNFSALVIYTSVLAVAADPGLWDKFYSGDNLLLTAADYRNTQNSAALKALRQSPETPVRDLAELIQQCCLVPPGATPRFEDVMVALEQSTLAQIAKAVAVQEAAPVSTPTVAPPPVTTESAAGGKAVAAEETTSASSGKLEDGSLSSTVEPAKAESTPAEVAPPVASSTPRTGGLWRIAIAAAAVLVLGSIAGRQWFRARSASATKQEPAPATDTVAATEPEPAPPAPAPTPSRAPALIIPGATTTAWRTLGPEASGIAALEFAPAGGILAAGCDDGSIKLWDTASGQLRQTLTGEGDGVHTILFLPDGKSVVGTSGENTIRYWSLANGQVTRTVSDHVRNLWAVAMARSGQWLAAGAADRRIVRLIDPQNGAVRRLLSHGSWVRSADFSPDQSLVAVACWDDSVKIWDTATGQAKQTLVVLSNAVDAVCFSADNKLLATGGLGRTVKLWDVATGALRQTLIGQNGDLKCYAFSADGRLVAAGGTDKTVRVWDTANGELKRTFVGHSDAVTTVRFSGDGSLLASGSADRTVRLWEMSRVP